MILLRNRDLPQTATTIRTNDCTWPKPSAHRRYSVEQMCFLQSESVRED